MIAHNKICNRDPQSASNKNLPFYLVKIIAQFTYKIFRKVDVHIEV